ncbi:hypothetical protein F4604DRAFT_1922254 [Suillus subluteus]|nr:hypothetical protein F4604DRAFT_1922254 [Suillus subluteus]
MAHKKCPRSTSISSQSSTSSSHESSSSSSSKDSRTPPPKKQGKPKHVRSSTDKDISKSKKAKKAKTTQDDPHEEYLTAARAIASRGSHGEWELDESEADRESRKKRLSALNYQQLLQLAPGIRSLINDRTKAKELAKVAQKMNTDTMQVAIPSDGGMKPAFYTGSSSKTHLGVNHPILASFLCPISQLAVFNGDKVEGQKKLLNGKIAMFANDFPAFLWSGEPPGRDYE